MFGFAGNYINPKPIGRTIGSDGRPKNLYWPKPKYPILHFIGLVVVRMAVIAYIGFILWISGWFK